MVSETNQSMWPQNRQNYTSNVDQSLLTMYQESKDLIEGCGLDELIGSLSDMAVDYSNRYADEQCQDKAEAIRQQEDVRDRTQAALKIMKFLALMNKHVVYIERFKNNQ